LSIAMLIGPGVAVCKNPFQPERVKEFYLSLHIVLPLTVRGNPLVAPGASFAR